MDIKQLFELAGVDTTKGKAKTLVESSSRLEKLIGYYTDGFEGFGKDAHSKKIRSYVAGINGGTIKPNTPEYDAATKAILSYGSELSDADLK